jgi:hypothetical protein
LRPSSSKKWVLFRGKPTAVSDHSRSDPIQFVHDQSKGGRSLHEVTDGCHHISHQTDRGKYSTQHYPARLRQTIKNMKQMKQKLGYLPLKGSGSLANAIASSGIPRVIVAGRLRNPSRFRGGCGEVKSFLGVCPTAFLLIDCWR